MKTFVIISVPFLKEGPKKPFNLFAFNLIANNVLKVINSGIVGFHYSDFVGTAVLYHEMEGLKTGNFSAPSANPASLSGNDNATGRPCIPCRKSSNLGECCRKVNPKIRF